MPTIVSDGGGATATISLAEDRRGVTRVVATDPNPATISYSIVGGADQSLFQIDASTGLLALITPPDFESPADADHDNAYIVQVRASNGAQVVDQTITVNVADVNDVTGGAGPDILNGGPSGDVLDGFAGPDQLLGGHGADTFLINAPSDGVDTLRDFWLHEDAIGLDQIGFGIAGNGTLAANGVNFVVGAAATTSAPTIIYNASTMELFWDADGTGPGAPVEFARIDPGSSVVWADTISLGSHGTDFQIAGTGDFNHDGTSDVLFRNSTTGHVDLWIMANGNWSASVDLGSHGTNYQVAGIGDFNHDGTSDVLWRNPTTGQVDLWVMANGNWAGSIDLGSHGTNYQVAGIGDFNGDGTGDVLWRNSTTGQVDLWLMANGNWAGSIDLGSHGTNYQVAGIGDFNGDGTSDVLWRNPTTGQVDEWVMANGNWAGSIDLGSHGADWQVGGVADLNGNGTSDILWRNPTTGEVDGWVMRAGQWAASTLYSLAPDVSWQPGATGDFNGDHVADVLWRKGATGAIDEWHLVMRPAPDASSFVIEGNIVPNVTIPVDTDVNPNNVVEGAANGTTVGLTASSTNPNGSPVVYSLSDSAGGRFGIDATTGVVTVSNGSLIDFESSSTYAITVTATSGTLTNSRVFTIGVTDVNDNAPVFASGATANVPENVSPATTAYLAQATDADGTAPNNTISYSITGADAGLFDVNSATGAVTFKAAPDFEAPADANADNNYLVTVHANDGLFDTTRDVTITVTNVNDVAPVFSSGATGTEAENTATSNVVYDANASDADAPPFNAITFALSAGGDNDLFNIDATTGAVTFKAAPNFEAPADADHNNVYQITVHANDGPHDVTRDVAVTVTDLNDNPPIFTSSASPSLPENTKTVVALATTDADTVGTNPPVFSISGGADANFFQIAANGHTLEFKIAPDFEAPSSAAASNVYAVQVSAFDGVNTTVQSLTVAVTDQNDIAPVFASGATGGEPENTPTANVVYTAQATDADGTAANNTVTYSLSSGGDNDLFIVDGNTGFVTFKPFPGLPPDFENPADADHNNAYQITVHANDGVHDVTKDVTVTITDVNDNAPVFQFPLTSLTPPFAASSTVENAAYSFDAHATDADATSPNNSITYSLTGPDAGLLSISPSGAVTFNAAPDFEASADADHDNVFQVTVHAIDNGVHDVTRDLRITVTDANDNTPSFTSGTTANENENSDASTVVYTAVATDADATAPNKTVTYSLAAHQAGVDDNNLFSVDGTTGEVRFLNSPDFENAGDFNHDNSYVLKVTATDGGTPANSATRTVTVAVGDLNDNAPVFVSNPPSAFTTPENASYSFNAHASDADLTPAFSAITYSLSGDDAGQFSISNTGVVTYVGLPSHTFDFEAPTDLNLNNVYVFTVHANDGTFDTTQDVAITVTDAPDVAPTFTSGTTGSEAEGTANTNVVYHATTSPSGGITFSLASGGDNDLFSIDGSGNVTFIASPDFEAPDDANHDNVYKITVQATGGFPTASQNVDITVTDVAPSFPAPPDPVGSINEGDGDTGPAVSTGIHLTSSDPLGTTVNFTLTNSAGGRFAIDASNNIVTGANASLINYETSGATHSYTVVVQASTTGGAVTTSKSYAIDVGNEPPLDPTTDGDATTPDKDTSANRIAFLAADGTPVGVTAFWNDPNGGPLTYSFVGGTTLNPTTQLDSTGTFALDVNAGMVTLAGSHTALTAIGTHYDLQIQASDGTAAPNPSDTQTFTVDVTGDTPFVDLDASQPSTGYSNSFTEGGAALAISNANITITDPASSQLVSATVTLTNAKAGDSLTATNLTGGGQFTGTLITPSAPVFDAGAGTITITLTGNDTLAHYQTAIHDIVFNNTSQNPDETLPGGRVINVVVNDGANDSNVAQATISVTAVNDAPVIAGSPAAFTFTEDDATHALFAGVSITDADSPANFSSGTLTATITAPQAGDQIVLQDATYAVGGNVVGGGSQLLHNGVMIGTIVNLGTGAVTVFDLTSAATLSEVNALAHAFGFRNVSDNPAVGTRSVELKFDDGGHTGTGPSLSNTVTQTVTVAGVNDAPTAVADSYTLNEDTSFGTTVYFAEHFANNSAGWALDTEWQIGSATASTGQTYGNPDPATDTTPTGDNGVAGVVIGGNANASTLHPFYYLTSPVFNTAGAVGSVYLTFNRWLNSDYDPFMHNKVEVWNGSAWISLFATGASPGIQDDHWAAVQYDVTPYENPNMRVRFGFDVGALPVATVSSWNVDDVLVYSRDVLANDTDPENDPLSAILVSGPAHAATFSINADGSFSYTPTSNFNGTDSFTYKVNDGTTDGNTVTVTLTVTEVNDAPVLAGGTATLSPSAISYTENAAPTALLASSSTVTDVDSPANFAGGSFTVQVASAQAGDQISILDPNFTVSGGALLFGGHTIATSISFGLGSATVSGLTSFATPSVVNELVGAFGYGSTSDDPTFVSSTRTVNFTFNDGGNTGTGGAHNSNALTQKISISAVDDAPVNHVPSATQVTTNHTDITFSPFNTPDNGVTISDVDIEGHDFVVTLHVDHGTLTLSPGFSGLTFTAGPPYTPVVDPGNDGTDDADLQFQGTLSDVNAALDGLIYHPNAGYTGSDTLTITTDDLGNSDNVNPLLPDNLNGGLTDTDTVNISVNAAPTLDLDGNNSTAQGTSYSALETNAATPVAVPIADDDVTINPNPPTGGADHAVITLTNAVAGDLLSVPDLSAFGITSVVDATTPGIITVTLTGTPGTTTVADFDAAIDQVEFNNTTSPNNTNFADRHIDVVVYDGSAVQTPANLLQSQVKYVSGEVSEFITTADFNNDGNLDLAFPNFYLATATVSLGNGDGTFQSTPSSFAAGNPNDGSVVIGAGDVSNDGNVDLVVTNTVAGTVDVLLGNGDGTFQSRHEFATGPNPGGVVIADVNGDGNADLLIGNGDDTITVLLGDGTGAATTGFTAASGSPIAGGADFQAGDFDGDHKVDLIARITASGPDQNNVYFLKGNGDGTFAAPDNTPVTGNLIGTAVGISATGDVNADGKRDVVLLNNSAVGVSSTATVLLGVGDGTFTTAPGAPDFGIRPNGAVIGDINGDGKADLIVSDYNDGVTANATNLNVLIGNGDGTFGSPQTFLAGVSPVGEVLGDFDGKNGLDVAVINRDDSPTTTNFSIYLNNSANTSNTAQSTVYFHTLDLDSANPGTGFTGTFVTNGPAVAIDNTATGPSGLTITEPALDNIASATVTLTNAQTDDALLVGGLAGPTGTLGIGADAIDWSIDTSVAGKITVTFTNSGGDTPTIADYEAALQAVTFSNPNTSPSTVDRIITAVVSDGATNTNTATSTIHVVNSPTLDLDFSGAGTGFTTTYTENGTPVAIADIDVTITDPNSTTISSATIQIAGNKQPADLLSINGALPAGITATAYNGGSGTLTLNSASGNSLADFQAALQQVVFSNQGDDPTAATRDITVVINDGIYNSNIAHATVNVAPVSDAPIVTTSNGATSANEQIATAIDSTLTVTDADSPTLDHATVSITGNYQAGEDVLAFVNDGSTMGNIAVQTNAAGVLTLNSAGATATPLQWQSALRAVTYTDGSNTPNTAARTITFVANDGSLDSTVATKTVNVVAVNDAPTLDLDTGSSPAPDANAYSANYTSTGTPIAITGTVGIGDPDGSVISHATITLTDPLAGDSLSIVGGLPAGISASFSNANHTIDLSGNASFASYQTALHQIEFSTTGAAGDRHIDIFVKDNFGPPASSNTPTSTITVAANTGPTATADTVTRDELGGVNNGTVTANSGPISGNVLTNDTDTPLPKNLTVIAFGTGTTGSPDNGTLGAALLGTYGTLTINSDGTFTYAVDNALAATQLLRTGVNPTDVFHYTTQDPGGLTSSTTFTATVNGAEDKPLAVNDLGSMGEDSAATSFEVRANDSLDPDAASGALFNTIAVSSPINIANTAGLTFVSSDVTAAVDSGSKIQLTLGAKFQQLKNGETATVDVPYTLTGNNDGGVDPSTGHLFVTVNGADDFPLAVDDGSLASPFATITQNQTDTTYSVEGNDTLDVDHDKLNTVVTGAITVTSTGTHPEITAADLTLSTPGGNKQVEVVLSSDFKNLQVGEHTDIKIHYTLQGSPGEFSGADLYLQVTGLNDAPVVTAGTAGSFTENSAAQTVVPNLTITDIDNTTLSAALVDLTNAKTDDALSLNGQAGTSGTLNTGADAIDWAVSTATPNHIKVNFTPHPGAAPTLADFQNAIHLVQFGNPDDALDATTRTFTVTATDNGDGINSPTDLTGSANVNFAVTAVNDAPVETPPSPSPAAHYYINSNTATPITGFVAQTFTDPDAGTDNVQVTLGLNHGGAIHVATGVSGGLVTGDITANDSSSITITASLAKIDATFAASGGITYTSSAAFNGLNATPANNIEALTITVNDLSHNPTVPNNPLTDQHTVQIGVLPKVWFIDNSANPGDDLSAPLGSQKHPFTSIDAFNTANGTAGGPAAGDTVFIRSGTYDEANGGIKLLDNQKLIGQGDGLAFQDPFAAAGTNITVEPTGARPIIQVEAGKIGIDLGSGNDVHGLDIDTKTNAGAVGIDDGPANNSVGSLHIADMKITGTGKAIDIDHGGALTVTLDQVTSTGSSTQGINLGGGLTGSLTVNNTGATSDIHGATGADINLTGGGSLGITYHGNITQSNNAALLNVDGGNATGGHTGTLAFDGTLSATNGTGLQFANADGTYNFDTGGANSTTLAGGNAGIDILKGSDPTVGSSGTFNFGTSGTASTFAITNPSGAAFNLNSGNATVNYHGNITANNGSAVTIDTHTGNAITFDTGSINSAGASASGILVQNNTGGTVTFNNPTIAIDTHLGANNGVTLSSNTGATINFTPTSGGNGLDIATSSGGGFSATGGGTVSVTQNSTTGSAGNTVTTTSGTAVNISGGTTIGASGVTFQSVSSNGAVNAIVLNGTGSNPFTITGDGSTTAGLLDRDGSGGTIQNTTHDAVLLTNAAATLKQLNITNAGWDGVQATGSGNVTLSAVDINHPGNANPAPDGSTGNPSGFGGGNGFYVENGTGTYSFDNNSRVINWQSSQSNAILLHNTNANFTSFTVDHALISTSATGAAGFHANLNGTTNGQVNLTNSEFTLIDQNAAQILNNGSGTIRAIVQGNNFHDADATGGDGNNTLFLANSHEGHLNFTIGGAGALGNTFHNLARLTTLAGVIQVDAAGGDNTTPAGGTINGTITNNNIFNDAGFVNGRRAIDVQVEADSHNLGPLAVAITNNTVNNVQGTAIHVSVVSVGNGSVTNGNWTITGNNLGTTTHVGLDNTDSASAIEFKTNVDVIASSTAVLTNNLLVSNNTAVNKANNATGGTLDISNIGGSGAGGLSTLNATITNNNLTNQDTAGSGHVLDVLNSSASSHETLNLNITGNNTTLGASTAGEIRLRELAGTFNIQGGLAGVSGANSGDTVNTTGSFGTVASVTLPTAPSFQMAAGGQGPDSSGILTSDVLAPIVAEAIQHWVDAGVTADQIAAFAGVHFNIADLADGALGVTLGSEIALDVNGAGWGWFVDPTPARNEEFDHADSSGQLIASSGEASGHIDLLTVVEHELGHVLGLGETDLAGDLMAETLDTGERRLPSNLDVAGTQQVTIVTQAADAENALPAGASAPDGTSILAGSFGDDTIHTGAGGVVLAGGLGADTFVVDQVPGAAPAHIADYSALQSDTIDLSALAAMSVRVAEDASDAFASLQVSTGVGQGGSQHWVEVAQLDGVHAGDSVNVILDGTHALHQLHAGWLA